jgi:hypothetical protein
LGAGVKVLSSPIIRQESETWGLQSLRSSLSPPPLYLCPKYTKNFYFSDRL